MVNFMLYKCNEKALPKKNNATPKTYRKDAAIIASTQRATRSSASQSTFGRPQQQGIKAA